MGLNKKTDATCGAGAPPNLLGSAGCDRGRAGAPGGRADVEELVVLLYHQVLLGRRDVGRRQRQCDGLQRTWPTS